MNPTNESIGRAFREAKAGSFVHTTQVGLFRLILDRARELDREQAANNRQAPGDDSLPSALIPHQKEWYRLCERRFYVDRMFISGELAEAIVEAVRAAPQPPAQEQGEALPVIADYTPVPPEEEAEIDAALGLVKVRMRVPADLHRELVTESEARGLVLAAVIRERLTRAAGAEDARDAARYRWLRDADDIPMSYGATFDRDVDDYIALQAQEGEDHAR